ncbi:MULTISPECIES: cytochrome C assembly family protein [unclassified Pseudomonas]|uniref:cytochrome C assembly family protein n=1 Tax=unclassified Pseudomonas TaxID=196821 RepID=UPI002B22C8D6|nr:MULTISPECIES: cytochrome c biogenesis protein CcsA [unclassified Pseudomonas]MEA9977725.1 cytochrome c biogenesis protein CcsA [Pseudomonas sp. RTS4]MEB0196016.1 cytochrome c biogenesis protein CcsA [Pseudomonas sp. 5S4]MEB0245580.1 cytochrome c biogenesis protein CcsA [Pseudomonas sp. 10S5]
MLPLPPSLLTSLAAAFLYAAATLYQALRLKQGAKADKRLLCLLGSFAVIAHAVALYSQLIRPIGLGLDFFSAASMIAIAIIVVTMIACARIPVENLLVLVFPLGLMTTLLSQFAPSGTVQIINEEPGILSHIVLSILAYGMFTIAVLQALLLLMQDHRLKHKHPSGLIKNFPPLQTMESLLFGFLWAGWILLSLSLISGWLFVENLFAQHLVHKTLLACLAWLVFSVLLWGRNRLGWRGHKAIRLTLGGFCLLMLAFFGSKLVREFILHI